jgi:hypothetical protein
VSAKLSRRGWVPAAAESHVQAIARQVAQQSADENESSLLA